jgi:Ca2+-binding RTX toxin-like protein
LLPLVLVALALLTLGVHTPLPAQADFIRGDVDASETLELTDAVRIFGFLFLGNPAELPCLDAADGDDSGDLTITDGIYLLGFLFLGASPPPAPHPACGPDPTEDPLSCSRHAACPTGPPGIIGPPDAPANEHLPDVEFPEPDPADFADVGGVPMSRRTFLIIFAGVTTVREANELLGALQASIIGAIPDFALVYVRLPDIDIAQAMAVFEDLQDDPRVAAAVMDFGGMQSQQLPPHNVEPPNLWTWELTTPPVNGNWGLKMIRAPQLWSLETYVRRNRMALDICAGVLEAGGTPDTTHPDAKLIFDGGTANGGCDHATLVSGFVGADWDNNTGVEGVDPWLTRIYARGPAARIATGLTYAQTLGRLTAILGADTCVKAVNNSYGYHPNPDPGPAVLNAAGNLVRAAVMCFAATNRGDFFLVSSAGNGGPGVSADLNSAISNAAHNFGDRFLAVMSSDNRNLTSVFSDLGGSVSAPGECVRSVEASNGANFDRLSCPWVDATDQDYATNSGTSFAAPHVTGLITALWRLEPALGVATVRRLVTDPVYTFQRNAVTLRTPRIDAFAAAMGIDVELGTKTLQSALVDVDDGSLLDGNARVDKDNENDDDLFTEPYETARAPGVLNSQSRRGDDRVDMKDFRAFRDAMLEVLVSEGVLAAADVSLDGPETHFKKDLNLDGCVGNQVADPPHPPGTVPVPADCTNAPAESVYPRYDFNGDGRLHPDGRLTAPPPRDTNGDGMVDAADEAPGVSPFKVDPDTFCMGLMNPAGCLRDIDVLADIDLWQVDQERVSVDPADEGQGDCVAGDALVWLPASYLLADRAGSGGGGDGVIDYLLSGELHFTVGTGLPPGFEQVTIRVTSRIDGSATWSKCIRVPRSAVETKLVLSVPLWDAGSRRVTVLLNELRLNVSFQMKFGEDRRVLCTLGPTIEGTGRDDVLMGTDGDDIIFGGVGNDTIIPLGGNDILCGGEGNDTFVIAGPGIKEIDGGNGTDTVDYSNMAAGVTADLSLELGPGGGMLVAVENLIGSAFDDVLVGDFRANRIQGRAGSDKIDGREGQDDLLGEEGNDEILGGLGNDGLQGGAGDDTIYGDDETRTRGSEADVDSILAGDGNDMVFCGPGSDSVRGEAGDDQLFGDDGRDMLRGGLDNDTLRGGPGNDMLFGDAHSDPANPGSGADLLMGEDGIDTLNGGEGPDELHGGAGADNLIGAGGDDDLFGEGEDDGMSGGAGNDCLFGGPGNDIMCGSIGDDLLDGGDGNDFLISGFGASGNDTLLGGEGDDCLQDDDPVGTYDGGPGTNRCNPSTITAANCTPSGVHCGVESVCPGL